MHLVVIDRLDPGGEQRVQLEQPSGGGQLLGGEVFGAAVGDLDEELITDGAEESFDFAPSLGSVWGGVHQPDPELAAGPEQPGIDVGRPVVDVAGGWHPAGGQRGLQCGGQPHGVLGEPEPVARREPCVIVEEREQVGLAAADPWAVQRVTDPPFVGVLGLETAEHHPATGGGAHQLVAVEQSQQRRL